MHHNIESGSYQCAWVFCVLQVPSPSWCQCCERMAGVMRLHHSSHAQPPWPVHEAAQHMAAGGDHQQLVSLRQKGVEEGGGGEWQRVLTRVQGVQGCVSDSHNMDGVSACAGHTRACRALMASKLDVESPIFCGCFGFLYGAT